MLGMRKLLSIYSLLHTKYHQLLKKFKPDLVIGYNFGDIRHFLINKLCDKNKIITLEVQGLKSQATHVSPMISKEIKVFLKVILN